MKLSRCLWAPLLHLRVRTVEYDDDDEEEIKHDGMLRVPCSKPAGLGSRCHFLNQGTWGGWILTLHLNYVAGCTSPLPFLFEQTHNYSVDKQGLMP